MPPKVLWERQPQTWVKGLMLADLNILDYAGFNQSEQLL